MPGRKRRKTVAEMRAQEKRAATKKTERARAKTSLEAHQTEVLWQNAAKIRDAQGIMAARTFLKQKGYENWRKFY